MLSRPFLSWRASRHPGSPAPRSRSSERPDRRGWSAAPIRSRISQARAAAISSARWTTAAASRSVAREGCSAAYRGSASRPTAQASSWCRMRGCGLRAVHAIRRAPVRRRGVSAAPMLGGQRSTAGDSAARRYRIARHGRWSRLCRNRGGQRDRELRFRGVRGDGARAQRADAGRGQAPALNQGLEAIGVAPKISAVAGRSSQWRSGRARRSR